jgi:diaminopimelate decarboxylase
MSRVACRGSAPLTARVEPWQAAICADPGTLAAWIGEHGSPLNVLDAGPLAANADELRGAARAHGLELGIYLARKANKALAFVDAARDLGLGVDVASERELAQTLARDVPADRIVVTAAVKPRALLELAAAAGATIVIDNADELALLAGVAGGHARPPRIAFRLAPRLPGRPRSRFGLPGVEILELADATRAVCELAGVHFHLDGYAAADRATALAESLALVDALRARGHSPRFVDIGGGIPMSYLDDAGEWQRFWDAHRTALGTDRPLTFGAHPLAQVYPYHQSPARGRWLDELLGSRLGDGTAASALRARGLELRCEPGRALLDGCGMTAARVEFRKRHEHGAWLIGLAMNRTQCRSTSDDFLVDPLLLRPGRSADDVPTAATGPIEGFLVGAYCIERELLTWRRLHFADGVEVGDIVVFPNTAGYLMHILESASHQIPLARNVLVRPDGTVALDAIDEPA